LSFRWPGIRTQTPRGEECIISTDDPFIPPKKKPSIFWWLGGAFVLLVMLFFFQLFGPSPPITISKQTTYVTDPLLPSGLPNYEEYIRRKLRDGVTRENNAAVLLFEALWPSELAPDQYEAVATELGLNEIPSADSALKSVHGDANRKRIADWLPKPTQDEVDAGMEPHVDAVVESVLDAALEHPWTSEQLPPLAEWVEANKAPLDLIVEASRRPRYYSPSPTFLDNRHDMLITLLLPGTQAARDGARGLKMRAMRHIGENRLDEAWQDILALHRLSSLLTQGSSLVEQLVGMAIRGMAIQATAALLSSDQLTKELAEQIQNDVATVPPFANVANCVDQMERMSGLDAVVHMKMYGSGQLQFGGGGSDETSPVDYLSIDWNVALKKLNQAYDEAAAAMRLPPGDQRQQALNQFSANLEADAGSVRQPSRLISALLSRSARSDVAGSIIQAMMLPAIEAALAAEERTNSMSLLTPVAAALAAYRAEHGDYPEKLEELVPGILPALPVDLFHRKPLVYKRLQDGYLLYSTGMNGQDDAGSNEQMSIFEGDPLDGLEQGETEALREKIPGGADDHSIRLPVSPFKLPKPRAPE
jgi:hypothetical protein